MLSADATDSHQRVLLGLISVRDCPGLRGVQSDEARAHAGHSPYRSVVKLGSMLTGGNHLQRCLFATISLLQYLSNFN
jgi:hypothetical protein